MRRTLMASCAGLALLLGSAQASAQGLCVIAAEHLAPGEACGPATATALSTRTTDSTPVSTDPKTCPDGVTTPPDGDMARCPAKCADGTRAPGDDPTRCPTVTCEDGSDAPDGKLANCPTKITMCDDGVTPAPDGDKAKCATTCGNTPCPDGLQAAPDGDVSKCPEVDCPDGTKVPNGQTCPPVQCLDGTTVPNGETCPIRPDGCPVGSLPVLPKHESEGRHCPDDRDAMQFRIRTFSGACPELATWSEWTPWEPACPGTNCADGTPAPGGDLDLCPECNTYETGKSIEILTLSLEQAGDGTPECYRVRTEIGQRRKACPGMEPGPWENVPGPPTVTKTKSGLQACEALGGNRWTTETRTCPDGKTKQTRQILELKQEDGTWKASGQPTEWTPACPIVMCPDKITPAPNGDVEQCPIVRCDDGSKAPDGDKANCPVMCPDGETEAPGGDVSQCKEEEDEKTPGDESCAYSWLEHHDLWLGLTYANERLTALGYTPTRKYNELAFARGFDCFLERDYLGDGKWGPAPADYRCDLSDEVEERVKSKYQIRIFGTTYDPIWVNQRQLTLDNPPEGASGPGVPKVIGPIGIGRSPVSRVCGCEGGQSWEILAGHVPPETGVPDGPWIVDFSSCTDNPSVVLCPNGENAPSGDVTQCGQ